MQEIIDVFGLNGKLLVIQIFNFGVLLLILWYFLYTPVIRMLTERQKVIEKGVKDAETAALEREKIAKEKESIITAATVDASTIVEKAKKRGEEKGAEALQEAKKKGDRLLAEAAMKAAEEKNKALAESKEEIAHMTILGVEKILRNQGTNRL